MFEIVSVLMTLYFCTTLVVVFLLINLRNRICEVEIRIAEQHTITAKLLNEICSLLNTTNKALIGKNAFVGRL